MIGKARGSCHRPVRGIQFHRRRQRRRPTRLDPAIVRSRGGQITVEKVLGGADGWNPALPPLDPAVAANLFDIAYGEANGEKLLLDAHVPPGTGPFPVVLIVHGGGWMGGDREGDIVPVFAPVATNFTWLPSPTGWRPRTDGRRVSKTWRRPFAG